MENQEEKAKLLIALQDRDDDKAYAKAKEVAAESELSDKYYSYLKDFASLLNSQKSYIRTRAFILCCSQARWDNSGVIKEILPHMLQLLHDEKPTVVKQCLNAISEIIVFRTELAEEIGNELSKIDLGNYKESMSHLIEKDIMNLHHLIAEVKNEHC